MIEKPGGTLRPTRKEDDILYQWRLKRKMELAKERVYSGMTRPVVQERFNSMKNRLIGAGVCNKVCIINIVYIYVTVNLYNRVICITPFG